MARIIGGMLVLVAASTGSAVATQFVTGRDVKDATLTYRDIKPSSITLDRLSRQVRLAIGRAGAETPASLRVLVVEHSWDLVADQPRTAGVTCPAGMIVTGGGASAGPNYSVPAVVGPGNIDSTPPTARVLGSSPSSDASGWVATAVGDDRTALTITALCAVGHIG